MTSTEQLIERLRLATRFDEFSSLTRTRRWVRHAKSNTIEHLEEWGCTIFNPKEIGIAASFVRPTAEEAVSLAIARWAKLRAIDDDAKLTPAVLDKVAGDLVTVLSGEGEDYWRPDPFEMN